MQTFTSTILSVNTEMGPTSSIPQATDTIINVRKPWVGNHTITDNSQALSVLEKADGG